MTAASPLGEDLARQNRARSAISALEHFHKIKTTVIKPIPHSLQLLLILSKNGKFFTNRHLFGGCLWTVCIILVMQETLGLGENFKK